VSDWEQQCQADARLAILADLARQRDATSNSMILHRLLDAMGMRRSREWVDTQLARLEELGAVNIRRAGGFGIGELIVVTLTRTGRDHVERRSLIAGVSTPADEV